jgi:hypothetical protein
MAAAATTFGEGTARLRGVEIFAAGTHRGKTYSKADLDQMVGNFRKYSSGGQPALRVPAVIGHEEDQEYLERSDLPAAGWCERVYREGPKLKADFGDVPAKVTRLLKGKAYRTVSSEVYDAVPDGLPGAGTPGKMLRRVAFLGGEIPQVKSLADIPTPEEHRDKSKYEAVPLKFSEARPFLFAEDSLMDRAAMLKELEQMGFSADAFPEVVPDATLAEILRVYSAQQEEEPTEEMPEEEKKAMGEAYAAKCMKYRSWAETCGHKFDDTPAAAMPAAGGNTTDGANVMAADGNVSNFTPPAAAPKKVTHTMQFSEEQIKSVAKLAADEIRKELGGVKDKVAELDKFAEKRVAAEKQATIKARLDTLVQLGKVLPVEIDAGLAEDLYGLDALAVHKFSEGGKEVPMTRLDHAFKTLEARPNLVQFGERAKSRANGNTSEDAELAKLDAHFEQFSEGFKRNGITADKLKAGFKAERGRKPQLTADQYLGV